MVGNFQKMMKQVQKMQEDMLRLQEEMKTRTVEGSAGGGMVKVVVNGHHEVLSVQIQPEAISPEDVEMLQDMLVAAINDGLRKAREMVTAEMNKIAGGLGLPPNLPGLW